MNLSEPTGDVIAGSKCLEIQSTSSCRDNRRKQEETGQYDEQAYPLPLDSSPQTLSSIPTVDIDEDGRPVCVLLGNVSVIPITEAQLVHITVSTRGNDERNDYPESNPSGISVANASCQTTPKLTTSNDPRCSKDSEPDVPSKDKPGKTARRPPPLRPCLFSSKMTVKFSRHITTVHGNETRVKHLLAQRIKERSKLICKLRKEAINKHNITMIRECSDNLLMETRGSSTNAVLCRCSTCNGFYRPKFFSVHKCTDASSGVKEKTSKLDKIETEDPEFNDLLSSFRKTEIGDICRKDPIIRKIGYQLHSPSDKVAENRKHVSAIMRQLAHINIHMLKKAELNGSNFQTCNIFDRDNIGELRRTMKDLSQKDGKAVCKSHITIALD